MIFRFPFIGNSSAQPSIAEKCAQNYTILYRKEFSYQDVLAWHEQHAVLEKLHTGVVLAKERPENTYCMRISSLKGEEPVETCIVYCINIDCVLLEKLDSQSALILE